MTIARFIFLTLVFAWRAGSQPLTNERCDDDNEELSCCFLNAPSELSHVITIAGPSEPGERLKVNGVVKERASGRIAPGVTIYAYHTDENGIYPKRGDEKGIHVWHGYLHAWGKTNNRGEFEIRTIRPARYPSGNAPAHIHLVVKEPGGRIYYVNDILFHDDPLVKNKREEGVISVMRNEQGVWVGNRTVLLR